MKTIGIIFGLLLAALLLPAATSAQIKFQESECAFDGTYGDRAIADFNGDGRPDILIEYTRHDREKTTFAAVCLQKADGSFGPAPDILYTFPAEARAFAAGDVAAPPGDELVIITGKGVFYPEKTAAGFGALQPLALDQNLFTGSEPAAVRLHRFLWDLDGDKKPELVLPADRGPRLYKRNAEGKFSLLQQVNLPAEISYRIGSFADILITDDINQLLRFQDYEKRVIASHTLPDLFFQDANGDGRLDLIGLLRNKLRIFCQNPDGGFPDRPTATHEVSVLTPADKNLSMTGEALAFADLDRDGALDLIMTKWGSTQNRAEMTRYLYFGRPGMKWEKKADQIISSTSAGVEFGIADLNGDGKLDLIIPYFHFAPAQAFKIMTDNSIRVQFQLYLMGPNRRYSQDPGKAYAKVDRRVPLNYKIDIIGMIFDFQSLIQGKVMPMIHFGKDFNGDGLADLLADTGGDKATFYWGNKSAEYAKDPNLTIPLESAFSFDLADLNGDKKTDLVTYYESKERVETKRKMAQKAREQAQQGAAESSGLVDEAALLTTAEATRVKVLLSRP